VALAEVPLAEGLGPDDPLLVEVALAHDPLLVEVPLPDDPL